MNRNASALIVALAFGLSSLYAEDYTRPRLLETMELNGCGGTVFRIPGFDFRKEDLQWESTAAGYLTKNDADMKYDTPIVYSTGRDLIPHVSLQCNDLPVVAKDALRTFLRFGRNSPHRRTTFECYLFALS